MRVSIEQLEVIVRKKVCTDCRQRSAEGACAQHEPERCSLFSLFPLVVQAIAATDSDRVEAYLEAIRENVCSVCVDQKLDGTCPQRNVCALNAHLPAVIEAIEEAMGKTLIRQGIA